MELTPDFSISINGSSTFPKERVISIRTTDEAGIVSDSCEIELDDFDGALQFPNTEAKVVVSLGYKETGLTKIGTYFVREISIDGARHIVRIQCNAASKAMRSQKTKTNEGTIENKLQEMGSEFELDPEIDDGLKEVDLTDPLQFAESDMNYITRISQKIGAVAKPVDGHLVIASDGSGKSVSGKSLPVKYLDASEVADYSCNFKETEAGGFSGTVYANWYEKETGEYHLEKVGNGDPETELQEIFATKEQALAAAKAKFKRTAKANKTFRFSIAGRTDLFAESPIVLRGFDPKIPTKWIMNRVEHSLSSNGFVTNVDCCNGAEK
jgi:hypothetical protein